MANPLKIGANVPDFFLNTTFGDFSFHEFLNSDPNLPWTIFFSHPNDFTPVCTTELGACHNLSQQFAGMGAKLIGLSCNTTDSHLAWGKDVLANLGNTVDESLAFPIIADPERAIVATLGMLDPEEVTAEGIPLPARALVILHGTTVRLTILYPATTGRNFEEIQRVLTSLQLTASNGLATPVDWKYGDRVIVGPAVKTEDAQAKFQDLVIEDLPSGKPYLRSVQCLEVTDAMGRTAAAPNTSAPPVGPNPLKIGATMPNFGVDTTQGSFALHDFLLGDAEKPWTIFFTHPKDFTPVCTTELGACHMLAGQAAELGAKLIGLSCDDSESHRAWSLDILARAGCANEDCLAFPLIADKSREIVTTLGMLDPEEMTAEGVPLPARALIILKDTTVKLTILYPATTGRNFDEVLRTLISLQLTAGNGLATPVDWQYGDRVIVGPAVKTEDAKAKFEDFEIKDLPSGKPYLRSVKCPDLGAPEPVAAAPVTYISPGVVSATVLSGGIPYASQPVVQYAAQPTMQYATQQYASPQFVTSAPRVAAPVTYKAAAAPVTYASAAPRTYANAAPVTYASAAPMTYASAAPVTYAGGAAPVTYAAPYSTAQYAAPAVRAPQYVPGTVSAAAPRVVSTIAPTYGVPQAGLVGTRTLPFGSGSVV